MPASFREVLTIPDSNDTISASAALDHVQAGNTALIDVRSGGEFSQAAVPGFINAPILTDSERHEVGIAYKQLGQTAAMALGHELVDPIRAERVAGWVALSRSGRNPTPIVTCWRGGLRSQIACEWLKEAGVRALRVEGGYKAMRQELLDTLATPPTLHLLAGLTGSGKTRLLVALPIREKVDLEALANHRGSSFGAVVGTAQPAQATFENAVALALRGCVRPVLVEDESLLIGSLHTPPPLRLKMQAAPVIYVEAPLDERVRAIFQEYVVRPLHSCLSAEQLSHSLVASVRRLARRLGGALTTDIVNEVTTALAAESQDLERHRRWIAMLLTEYYDKGYTYAFERRERKILFRGSYEECRQWILQQYA